MSNYRIGDGIVYLINGLMATCLIFVPLGLWKLVEIVIWLFQYIHFGVKP